MGVTKTLPQGEDQKRLPPVAEIVQRLCQLGCAELGANHALMVNSFNGTYVEDEAAGQ
jgi:hypothetical protein